MKAKKIEVGDVYPINSGGEVKVVEYINTKNIIVEHVCEHKHRMKVAKNNLLGGRVKNPYSPVVHGIGYLGAGPHKAWIRGNNTTAYNKWEGMLSRCYSEHYQSKKPTYMGCTVAPEWHNFQNFAEWFYAQPLHAVKGIEIDKDHLIIGNKEYGNESCSLMPRRINALLYESSHKRKSELPIGVYAHGKSYRASISKFDKSVILGHYCTIEEASAAYKTAKEGHVKLMANEYKDQLHPTVFNNLMNWTVD